MRPKILFSNVTKSFSLYNRQSDKILELFSFKKEKNSNFFAVKDISFEIYEGESIGIVGLNGSGKSTLCNLLSQVIPPTSGTIEIHGETSLIAISVGLNNNLSGIENIELKCLMHGLKKAEIDKLKHQIIEFADLGKFIDQPVKNYSSGMKSRLGFAISVHTNPDILIIDEALSVGDPTFYQKCIDKMNQFKSDGKTIIFISHSLSQIEGFCDRVLWMNFGRMEKFDTTKEVLGDYKEFINWFNKLTEEQKKIYRTEMLSEQYKGKQLDFNNESSSNQKARKRKKKGRTGFIFQLCLLNIAVILSACYMFGAQPIEGLVKIWNETINQGQPRTEFVNETVTSKTLNKNGIIVAKKPYLYADQELNQQVGQVAFLDEVFVKEQFDEVYKATVNGYSGYFSKEEIVIIDENSPETNYQPEEFLPLLPKQFADAYQYFFSFLNLDAEQVKSSIRENPIEGSNMLHYANYHVKYNLNRENKAQSITISDINVAIPDFNNIINSVSSIKDDYYYFRTKDFNVLIDVILKELTFIVKND